jgi:hypothetical protein
LQVLGVTNRRLFESFMYFVVQYCAAQPVGFFTDAVRGELVKAVAGTPAAHRAVVEQGCRGGILPLLDGFGRNRAQCACKIHRLVFGEGVTVTVESLVVWVLFECIFRYTGDAKVLAPDSKFFDHMMIALEMWGSQATGVARGLFDLMQCIEAQTDNLEEDERLVFEQCLCRSNQDQGQGDQNVSQGCVSGWNAWSV